MRSSRRIRRKRPTRREKSTSPIRRPCRAPIRSTAVCRPRSAWGSLKRSSRRSRRSRPLPRRRSCPNRRRPLRRLSPWLPNANSTAPASSGLPLTTAPPRPPTQRRKGPISNARRRSATCCAWSSKPPQTTVVLEPAVLKEGAGDPPALGKGVGSGTTPEKVLIPAGRGVYAHTILAVDSDTNGPIVLEADTGPIAGDRMIGSFSKSGNDRLIVRVETVEHRGKALEANGIVVAPDSMEEAVATSVDEHYLERFVLPAAAAFVQGLGTAVAMGNSTTTVSPFGGTTQSFGPLTVKQEALVAGGSAAQAVGNAMTASIPKGPTVHLAANVSVAVMFLSNVSIK